MRYLIVQDWKNTSNNHAGMKYLALQLHKLYPDTIAVYIVPDYDGSIGLKRNIWGNFVYKLQNRVNSFFVKIGLTESRTEKRLQNIKKELTEVIQDWKNTSNNHAGMKYLALQLHKLYPDTIAVYIVPDYDGSIGLKRNIWGNFVYKLQNRVNSFFVKIGLTESRTEKRLQNIKKELTEVIKDGDEVFLMEYLEPLSNFVSIASWVKENYMNCTVSCIVHLVPLKLDRYFGDQLFDYWMQPIDKVVTLGHSLSDYLVKRGVDQKKIVTSFHYVDSYYRNLNLSHNIKKGTIRVLAMGNQMRNQKLLKAIVRDNPMVEFTICQGCDDMTDYFKGIQNVELIPFVEEEQLRKYMADSDISLNVMVDTIGSNVIVTSMAMGLAMVCSDVGSIHDYCDETNCIFCDNNDIKSFSRAIALLSSDMEKLLLFKRKSIEHSQKLTIERFYSQIMES